METAMRAQRQKVKMLQQGGADPDDVVIAKAKYQAQLQEYKSFCKDMDLTPQMERVYIDGLGRTALSKDTFSRYTPKMIRNATRDSKQYDRYKNIVGDSFGSLADFRQMKYNNPEKFTVLKKKVDTYSEINKKTWSAEFKQKSKKAYDRFADEGIYMSVHALSRLPRLNQPGLPEVTEKKLIEIVRGKPQFTEGDGKWIYFDSELQLVVVQNKSTEDIISVVRRKKPKEIWQNV